jgi:hypothetical protein
VEIRPDVGAAELSLSSRCRIRPEGRQKLEGAFPMLQVMVYDAENKHREETELAAA